MSLDDLPRTQADTEPVVRRVDRPAPSQTKITRAEELRLQLADEIVRGALAPGAPLDETDIARRFNVSRTPVREALRQLAVSGLVEARAHRGAVVARPTIERLTGMFEAMAELEALCAGLAAERMTLATRVRVQPFRRAQFRNLGRLAKSHAEHDRVVVAIMRGDRVGAAGAMRAHIELVRDEYEIYAVSV